MKETARRAEAKHLEQRDMPRIRGMVQDIFSREFRRLGFLKEGEEVPLPSEEQWKLIGNASVDETDVYSGHVRLSDKNSKAAGIRSAIHEAIHVFADRGRRKGEGGGVALNAGYFIQDVGKRRFMHFNESVTEVFSYELLERYAEVIQTWFPEVTTRELLEYNLAYPLPRTALTIALAKALPADNGRTLWEQLIRAQFEGPEERARILEAIEQKLPDGTMRILENDIVSFKRIDELNALLHKGTENRS